MALTGTDLYRDIRRSRRAQLALDAAGRIVALQPLAADELEPHLRGKLRVIASPDGRDGSVLIHQDALLFAGLFEGAQRRREMSKT